MSVLDASAFAEALMASTAMGSAARRRIAATRVWHAPQVLPAEVLSAIRGQLLGGHLLAHQAQRARDRLARTRVVLHPFAPFADRIWQLRHNLTVYDAWYVALAERLDAPLVTADNRLAGADGTACEIELLASR